jgi:tRNA(fMet)-specific endonuclease VapC
MRYMLDTNICIYVIKQAPAPVLHRFRQHEPEGLGVSAITAAELAFGVAKSGSRRNRAALEEFLSALEIAAFDDEAARVYGDVRADVAALGIPIGPLDTQIAAHALSLEVTLVSNNLREFERVAGLRCANWVESS